MGMATRRQKAELTASAQTGAPARTHAVLPESGGVRTESLVSFHVHGLPVAQGSSRSYVVNGKPVITTTAKGLSSWRRLVADVAQRFAPAEPWEGPIRVDLHFGIPRPKSAPKKRRVWPDKRPDLDKLTRAVFDALTYVVFADDSQVVELSATKDYGAPGVAVEVRKIQEPAVETD